MVWAKLTCKATGESHWDSTPDAWHTDDYDVIPIVDDRCPEGLEDVDADGNIFIPVDKLRESLWESVKATRAEKLALAPTTFGTAQTDSESKENISGLVQMATISNQAQAAWLAAKAAAETAGDPVPPQPPIFAETFTMADNSEVEMDADQMISFGVQVGEHVSAVHARGRALRAEIYDPAKTVADLQGIDLAAGWP